VVRSVQLVLSVQLVRLVQLAQASLGVFAQPEIDRSLPHPPPTVTVSTVVAALLFPTILETIAADGAAGNGMLMVCIVSFLACPSVGSLTLRHLVLYRGSSSGRRRGCHSGRRGRGCWC
jgi:hypothetical protein